MFKDEFALRKKKNPAYSIRAFAHLLKLSPAYVSLIFRGKRNFSSPKAFEIAKKLNWPSEKQKYFVSLLEFQNPKTEAGKEAALTVLQKMESGNLKFNSLAVDSFALISEWHHNAILSYLTLNSKKNSTLSIAKHFALDPTVVESALRRLQRLGLAKQVGKNWKPVHIYVEIPPAPSQAVRSYHKQVLDLAKLAIDEQPFEQRDFSNITITVDRSRLELAKNKVVEFQNEMTQLLEGTRATEVYQLSVQLFKLSKVTERESK